MAANSVIKNSNLDVVKNSRAVTSKEQEDNTAKKDDTRNNSTSKKERVEVGKDRIENESDTEDLSAPGNEISFF